MSASSIHNTHQGIALCCPLAAGQGSKLKGKHFQRKISLKIETGVFERENVTKQLSNALMRDNF